ncbi:MAG TPA: cytochrome c, partial [Polyangiaceae bacterium LLY-WYZ-15_(1-7)]|nr:cytochrome c [Polyangiaceae bacterium LLY-WYZ-15_(1-7)]
MMDGGVDVPPEADERADAIRAGGDGEKKQGRLGRWLKRLGLGLLVVVVGFGTFVWLRSEGVRGERFQVAVAPVSVARDEATLARGEHLYLALGCAHCHGEDLGGARFIDDGAFGQWYGTNLTRGEGGVGARYGSADWVRAIALAVGDDGRGLYIMPSSNYAALSDGDLGALIAYIEAASPVDRRIEQAPGPIARMLMTFGALAPKRSDARDSVGDPTPAPT